MGMELQAWTKFNWWSKVPRRGSRRSWLRDGPQLTWGLNELIGDRKQKEGTVAVFDDAFPFLHGIIQTSTKYAFCERNWCCIFDWALLGYSSLHVHSNSQSLLIAGRACTRLECSHDYQIAVSNCVLFWSNNHDLGDNFEPQNAKV